MYFPIHHRPLRCRGRKIAGEPRCSRYGSSGYGPLVVPQISTAALRKQLAAEATGPLYMLVGDDDTEKSAVAGEFAEMVDEGLRAFNVERLFGGETSVDDLTNAAATLPMMAPRRVVLVIEAEKLLIPKRESKAADEEQERLERFIQDPPRPCDGCIRVRSTRRTPTSRQAADERSADRRLRHHCRRGRRRTLGQGAGSASWERRSTQAARADARAACRPRPRPAPRGSRARHALRDGGADDHGRRCSPGRIGGARRADRLRYRKGDCEKRRRPMRCTNCIWRSTPGGCRWS